MINRIGLICVFFFMTSCNLETNTSSPQSSKDISDSKGNDFFIKKLNIDSAGKQFLNSGEIWLESCWKNEIKNGKVSKQKTEGIQLNLEIMNFKSKGFNEKNYLINWHMAVDGIGVFGRTGNVYTLYINNSISLDTFQIQIKKLINDSYVTKRTFNILALETMIHR